MVSHAIFQYNVLAIDDTHNTWTNMIVKITILRLLGSSDDKEKIGVARPEGPPLRVRSKGFEDWRDREEKSKQSRQRYFSITGWTDAKKITYVGALTWSTSGSFGNTGWTDARKVEYVGAMNSAAEAKSIHRMNRR